MLAGSVAVANADCTLIAVVGIVIDSTSATTLTRSVNCIGLFKYLGMGNLIYKLWRATPILNWSRLLKEVLASIC
jgi:hypothetical protein